MKIVTHNAAAAFQQKIESLEYEHHNGWRCIYLRLSGKKERFDHEAPMYFLAIVDMFMRDEGHIYFCDDGDIFLLFKGALKPMARRLSQRFPEIDVARLSIDGLHGFFSFYDLAYNWQDLYEFSYAKAQRILPAGETVPHVIPASAQAGMYLSRA